MKTLEKLTAELNQLFQPQLFQDYCPNGLQIEGKSDIKRIATAVSANLETIQSTVKLGVDALIVHHGLFWNGDSPIITGSKRKKIELLLQNGISLLAYHLPLDAHQEVGNNWKAAKDLGWNELQPFGSLKGLSIGVKGKFSPQPAEHFIKKLEDYYGHKATIALGGKKKVKSAALVSGGGYKYLIDAAKEVDCYITGNFDEPAWSQANEEKINFFALGHSATERVGPKALNEYLQNVLQLDSQFIDIKNPF